MIPIISRLFADDESLLEYERTLDCQISYDDIKRRLVAIERRDDTSKSDSYYEGLEKLHLKEYESLSDLMISASEDLANEMLIKIGDVIYVEAQKFDEWMNLIEQVSPLWIIAGYILDDFDIDYLKNPSSLLGFVKKRLYQFRYSALLSPYLPDLDYLISQNGGLHDLHIHLNGSTEIDVLWNYMLQHPFKVSKDYEEAYLNNSAVRKLAEQVVMGFNPSVLLDRLNAALKLRRRILREISLYLNVFTFESPKENIQFIYSDSRYSVGDLIPGVTLLNDVRRTFGGDMCDELLFYLIVMKFCKIHNRGSVISKFHHYLLIKGQIQRFVVMQHSQVGFSQFQLITDNSFRWGAEKYYESRFRQLSGNGGKTFLRSIEGRFSPQNSVMGNRQIVSRILKGFEKARKTHPMALHGTELSLIAHFIKKPERVNLDANFGVRHYFLRRELKKKAMALVRFLYSDGTKYSSVIRGVDAAASEFDANPEVFAPTFRYLRNAGVRHFTFHAGEDFRHLLSGLRAIYEAVMFLQLQTGDRLGHCTAIGIDPKLWMERVGTCCFVKQGEWLDNLVFVWHLINDDKDGRLVYLKPQIESRIFQLSSIIYGEIIHPYVHYKAWRLRDRCPLYEMDNYGSELSLDYIRLKIEFQNLQEKGGDEWRLFLNYHGEVAVKQEYDKLIEISTSELFSIKDLEMLQGFVIDILGRKNVVIEMLPSSNLRISYYQRLKEYHLNRWLNKEWLDCIIPPVVVGSDDPGIFMTNIYNEYALAYLHLGEQNVSAERKMEKVRHLQEFSNIYRF